MKVIYVFKNYAIDYIDLFISTKSDRMKFVVSFLQFFYTNELAYHLLNPYLKKNIKPDNF